MLNVTMLGGSPGASAGRGRGRGLSSDLADSETGRRLGKNRTFGGQEMLQVVIGWVGRQFRFLPVETVVIDGVDALGSDGAELLHEIAGIDASQNGMRFQIDQFR